MSVLSSTAAISSTIRVARTAASIRSGKANALSSGFSFPGLTSPGQDQHLAHVAATPWSRLDGTALGEACPRLAEGSREQLRDTAKDQGGGQGQHRTLIPGPHLKPVGQRMQGLVVTQRACGLAADSGPGQQLGGGKGGA